MGVRIQGTLEDIDPLNRSLYKRTISRVKQGPWAILKMMTFDLYSGLILTKNARFCATRTQFKGSPEYYL